MRLLQTSGAAVAVPKEKAKEPMNEGLIKQRKPKGFYAKMSDDELVAFIKRFMTERGIRGRAELEKTDGGMYNILRKRGLLGGIRFEVKYRDWASMSDDEIVSCAKRFMEEKNMLCRGELNKADGGLYQILRNRGLVDRTIPISAHAGRRERRGWATMDDAQIILYAKRLMEEKGICGRSGLRKADPGLYGVLGKRKLLNKVGFGMQRRDWASMSDDEINFHTKSFIAEKGINGRAELDKADSGLYRVLRIRKLLDKVGLEEKCRNWSKKENEEIVAFAKRFIAEKRIHWRRELTKADWGLYQTLMKRKLLDEVGLPNSNVKSRDWASMSDNELISHGKKVMEDMGIVERTKLKDSDNGLYEALRKRKLLSTLFSDIDRSKERKAAQDIVDALADWSA